MRRRDILATAIAAAFCPRRALLAAEWKRALPGYRYAFPADHFDHPDFRTEWWYFTGNLATGSNRRFGYELTFFRQGLATAPPEAPSTNAWDPSRLYLAHLALTDVEGSRFLHQERLNRPGPGLAGVDRKARRIWNGNWSVVLADDTTWHLEAVHAGFTLRLDLRSRKAPVIHGENGVHQKAAGEGRASQYISLTRLESSGEIAIGGNRLALTGTSWMDHEFFTHQMDAEQTGWDWFAIQLDDGTELMIYRLRRRDGSIEPLSGGTAIAADGTTEPLRLDEIRLTPRRTWKSPETGGDYPIAWTIEVPRLNLSLRAEPRLASQEFRSERNAGPSYWEGAMRFEGTREGRAIGGVGYLELTGYAGEVNLGDKRAPAGISR